MGVAIAEAALQILAGNVRRQELEILGAVVVMFPAQRQQVVNGQAKLEGPAAGEIAFVDRQQEAERINQPWPFVQKLLALLNRSAGQSQAAFFEVAQSAMNQLGRAAGGAPGKVALLNQQGAQPKAAGFAQDAGAGNAAADDEDIPGSGDFSPLGFAPGCIPHKTSI